MTRMYISCDERVSGRAVEFAKYMGEFEPTEFIFGHMIEANWEERIRQIASCDAVVAFLIFNGADLLDTVQEVGAVRAFQRIMQKPLLYPIIDILAKPGVVRDLDVYYCIVDDPDIKILAGKIYKAFQAQRRSLPKIFISHRHTERGVARALVNLVTAAFDLCQTDLRCTSIHPFTLRAGDETASRLRLELRFADAVLGIISPDVKGSSYVLFELGASWGRSGTTFPLLVRGATGADVPVPIAGLHTLSLSDEADCNQLLDDLASACSLPRSNVDDRLIAERVSELTKAASA